MNNLTRFEQNLEILTHLKSGAINQNILKRYTGWGGLREAIYDPDIYKKLKSILTAEEILSLKQTLKNAYYTPKPLVEFIYQWLTCYGFKGGAILEPAVGNGIFIEQMPDVTKNKSHITAIELDKITSDITQQLYPTIELHQCAFENYQPNKQFDLIIGNPPYGANKVKDTHHADLSAYCIHHYFVAKSMRLLKEGGLLAMVLPAFFMDNASQHVRDIIVKEGGDLLAAYRLPDDLFDNAKVTIDIVFLIKGKTGKPWSNLRNIKVGDFKQPINEYFYHNSHFIFGNLEIVDMYERKGLACKRRGDTFQLLKHEMATLKARYFANRNFYDESLYHLNAINQQITVLQAIKQDLMELSCAS